MKRNMPQNAALLLGLAGFLLIFLVTVLHRQPPLFDEVLFIPNVYLFEKHGLSREFLVNLNNQAPGPLYEFVHYPLRSITHLDTPGIRLVNVFMLGLLTLVLARILVSVRNISFRRALYFSVGIMAVPMIWQVSGMALTEMPTMLFGALSLLLLTIAIKQEEKSALRSTLAAVLAGFALGLAILGRSPFLLLGLASFSLLLNNFSNPRRWRTVLLYSLTGWGMAVPVFMVWNGLVPPQQAFVGQGGISIWHGILAFAYGALLTLIIAPRWFYFNRRILFLLLGTYAALLLLNVYVLDYQYAPLNKTMDMIFPSSFMGMYPYIVSPLLATAAIYFIACSVLRAWQKRTDPIFLFFLACGMLILASSFKVTHLFSSRYVAQATPFFILVFPDYDRPTIGRALRFVIGMVIGFLSLETYFGFS
jgi:4-amino-4-deoxy-L-arabinose transferase-like glycosyltransferase